MNCRPHLSPNPFCPPFGPIPTRIRSTRRPGKSRYGQSGLRPTATTTVRRTRPGWNRPNGWGSEKAGHYPLHLTSNQPVGRLHSQLDQGSVSRSFKVAGREPLWLHPVDAQARGLSEGDIVRVFNDRGGQCLARGCALPPISNRAWSSFPPEPGYDPLEPGVPGSLEKTRQPPMCSLWTKAPQSWVRGPAPTPPWVQVERYQGDPPPVTAFVPPEIRQE